MDTRIVLALVLVVVTCASSWASPRLDPRRTVYVGSGGLYYGGSGVGAEIFLAPQWSLLAGVGWLVADGEFADEVDGALGYGFGLRRFLNAGTDRLFLEAAWGRDGVLVRGSRVDGMFVETGRDPVHRVSVGGGYRVDTSWGFTFTPAVIALLDVEDGYDEMRLSLGAGYAW